MSGGWSEPVDMTPRELYPTPACVKLLRQVDNDQVTIDITADAWRVVLHPNAPDQWQDQVTVTARIDELETAGWVLVDEARATVTVTDAGYQVLAAAGGA